MRKTALDTAFELARGNPRVVFIGSDLGAGTLKEFQRTLPDRFFMEGVAEANIIGMAAGLALEGFIPFVNTIATFITRRCYEQVAVDLCLHHLPVRLIGNGGGLVYAPLGPTHLAIEDIALLRALPGMTIVAPVDAEEMRRAVRKSAEVPGPLYFRLAKGGDPVVSREDAGFEIGRGILMREPGRTLFVSTGVMTTRCLAAAGELAARGIGAGVLHMHTVKPLDAALLADCVAGVDLVVTVEEHSLIGGLGSAVLESLSADGIAVPVLRLGIPDVFPAKYGSQDDLLELFGLQPPEIVRAVLGKLRGVYD
ncbi:MAG: transketolase [Alphaproteobacteria bacterium]|nr:transketolase [Alphaproteobacteria bacterium]